MRKLERLKSVTAASQLETKGALFASPNENSYIA